MLQSAMQARERAESEKMVRASTTHTAATHYSTGGFQ